jgi:hypothetical protein
MAEPKFKSSFRRKDVRIEDHYERIQGLWHLFGATEVYPIRIVDLSPDGFGMLVEQPLNDGNEIQVIFSLPSVLTVHAVVVWSQTNPETGLWRVGLNCDLQGKRRLESIYRQLISSSSGKPSLISPD